MPLIIAIALVAVLVAASPPPPLIQVSAANATIGSLGLVGTFTGQCIQVGAYNTVDGGSICLPPTQPLKYSYTITYHIDGTISYDKPSVNRTQGGLNISYPGESWRGVVVKAVSAPCYQGLCGGWCLQIQSNNVSDPYRNKSMVVKLQDATHRAEAKLYSEYGMKFFSSGAKSTDNCETSTLKHLPCTKGQNFQYRCQAVGKNLTRSFFFPPFPPFPPPPPPLPLLLLPHSPVLLLLFSLATLLL